MAERTDRVEAPTASIQLTRGVLMVVDGADAGRTVGVESGRIVIGSGDRVQLRLRERGVSKQHAEVEAASGGFRLRDLGSTNGTFLNGRKVGRAWLEPGDVVTLGTCRLRFEPKSEEVRILPSNADHFGPVVGRSLAMRQVFGVLERVAATDATVLFTGESGTGKDLAARALHAASRRAKKPFVVVDAGVASPELIAAELFGHEEGAFTGASRRRAGAFESAQGGTVFLDEIGELPLDLQPKFLRVLETREVRPLGTTTPVPVDVRIVAATHRDLAAMVREGRFREDLYWRLAVVPIELPPLRERREDVAAIARALLDGMRDAGAKLTDEAVVVLAAQAWRGNVRELRNVLERTISMCGGGVIEPGDLMLTPGSAPATAPGGVAIEGRTLEEIEREVVVRTLEAAGGNVSEAARRLGLHRNGLKKMLDRYKRDGAAAGRVRTDDGADL